MIKANMRIFILPLDENSRILNTKMKLPPLQKFAQNFLIILALIHQDHTMMIKI